MAVVLPRQLLWLLALAANSTLAVASAQPAAAPPQQQLIPGQAFHDWRVALIAAKYSRNTATDEWVNIVGRRDALQPIIGPDSHTALNPAADSRLQVVKALLAYAASATEQPWPQAANSGQHRGRHLEQLQRRHQQQQQQQEQPLAGPDSQVVVPQQLITLLNSQPYTPRNTDPAVLESTLTEFVYKGPGSRLYVKGQPWLLKGMEVPDALQLAAGGPEARAQLLYLLDRAQVLGLNTLRFRAFADGAPGVGSAVGNEWLQDSEGQQPADAANFPHTALQPVPGILNGTMLREGLDWLVRECSLRAIRLLPVLTNGHSAEAGGMKQYIDWIDPALTVTDFYSNDTIKSVFMDYVAAMLGHTSSYSGLPLREDPIIVGWQLAEEASHPGDPSSQTLLAWLRQFGAYIKARAPHQLLIPGVLDLFGHNSPHHLSLNPHAQVWIPATPTPHRYEPRCHGVDFWLHHQVEQADAAVAGVFPDAHVACNTTCKLDWAREWIRGHLRDAVRFNRPLILGGVGALRPHTWRVQMLELVHEELSRALDYGHPIGGVFLSGLSHPKMQDAGWGVYYTRSGVHQEAAPFHDPNTQAVADVQWRRFTNHDAFLTCMAVQARGATNINQEATNTQVWVDGWEDVVRAVAAIGKLPATSPAATAAALRSTE